MRVRVQKNPISRSLRFGLQGMCFLSPGPVKPRDQTLRHVRSRLGLIRLLSDLCAEQNWTMGRAFFIESSAAGSR
jgi:hypothetical protein